MVTTEARGERREPEPLALLLGADDNYAMPLAVALFTALEHLPPSASADVYIMDGGISRAKRGRVERTLGKLPLALRLTWITPDPAPLQGLLPFRGSVSYISKAAYLRLLAPAFVDRPKVIYLDSDLVVQRDLGALWDIDLSPYAAAAVLESGTTTLGSGNIDLDCRAQRLDPDAPYFNSGVLLLNLERWRAEGISERVLTNIREHRDRYRLADQDGLNVVLYGDWLALDRRWNLQASREALTLERFRPDDAFIIHFTNSVKPWMKEAFGAERPYFARFLRALERSGWFSPAEYLRFRARLAAAAAHMAANRVADRVVKRAARRTAPQAGLK